MNKNLKKLLAAPYIIWMIGFTFIPLLLIVVYGLTDKNGTPTIANIVAMSTPEHMKALLLSLGLSFISTVICLVLGYPLAYVMARASERRQKVTDIMKRMNISHRANHFPQQLSGGQQQRVAIARAVVAGPKLILADEPTGNLDSKNGKEVMDLLKELNQEGTTIVMVTHSQKDAACAQRTIDLFDGQIVSDVKNEL